MAGPCAMPRVQSRAHVLWQDDKQGTPRLRTEALQQASASGPARTCMALTCMALVGNAAWWTDDVLACVGASGLLAFLSRHGGSVIAERFSACARLASTASTAGAGARLFVIEPVLRKATSAQRSVASDSPKQTAGWGSSLSRMLSIGAADDLSDNGVLGGKQLAGWRLSVLDSQTPAAMLNVLLQRQSWAEAFDLCSAHALPIQDVHRARWLAEPVTLHSLQRDLAAVSDRRWAVEQLLLRTSQDEATQRTVLRTALNEIDRHCGSSTPAAGEVAEAVAPAVEASPDQAKGDSERLWWLCKRLQVLQRLDRQDTLCAVFDG